MRGVRGVGGGRGVGAIGVWGVGVWGAVEVWGEVRSRGVCQYHGYILPL